MSIAAARAWLLSIAVGGLSVAAVATPTLQEENRQLVIQHNPNIAQGREGLLAAVRRSRAPGAKPHSIKRLIASFAQDDLVVLVWDRDLPDPKNPGNIHTNNAFDMFRVKDGMVVEHWDDAHKNP